MSSLMEAENIHQDKENFQRVPSSRKTRRRGLAIREESIQNVHVLDGAGKEKADTGAPVTLECDFLESYLKPMTFFLMNGLSASLQNERADLVHEINKDRSSPTAWNNLLDHVNQHSMDSCEAKLRKRLYHKAQSLIPEAEFVNDPAYLSIWLKYATELDASGETEQKVRQLSYEYMKRRKIGERAAAFYFQWAMFEESAGNMSAVREVLDLSAQKNASGPKEVELQQMRGRLSPNTRSSFVEPMSSPNNQNAANSRSSDPSTPITPTLELSSDLNADVDNEKQKNSSTTFEMPDYMKNFDFRKTYQEKQHQQNSTNLRNETTIDAATRSATASTTSVEQNTVPKRSGLRGLAGGAVRVTEQNSILPPQAVTSSDIGMPLDGIAEQSNESSSLDCSRRDSTSSAGSRASIGFSTLKRSSISSGRSSMSNTSFDATVSIVQESATTMDRGSDDTDVVFKDSSIRRENDDPAMIPSGVDAPTEVFVEDVAMEDDTAVFFQQSSRPRRVAYMKGEDQTVTCNGANDDNTDVVFQKGTMKQPPQQQNQQRAEEVFKTAHAHSEDLTNCSSELSNNCDGYENSASLTCEAGKTRNKQASRSPSHSKKHQVPNFNRDTASCRRKTRGKNYSSDEEGFDSDVDDRAVRWNRTRPSAAEAAPTPFEQSVSSVSVDGTMYYKIGTLGKGGSSKVFRVLTGDGSGKIAALKRVRVNSSDPSALENFRNEIRLMEQLRGNPHIVELISSEVDVAARTVHIVMECGDSDLNSFLYRHQQQSSLSANFVRLAWQQMLTAVQVIHDARIVHGDLKPANFLFVHGQLKLIDFGIASQAGEDTTNIYRETQIGTVNYMSPEAIRDSDSHSEGASKSFGKKGSRTYKVGRASDIWSLGCILYQMVYGNPPFKHIQSPMSKLFAIVDDRHEIAFPQLSDTTVVETMKGCLQRDPSKRPSINGKKGLLLQPFLEPRLASASPPAAHAAIDISSIRMIVRRSVQACKEDGALAASVDELEEKIIEKLRTEIIQKTNKAPASTHKASASRVHNSNSSTVAHGTSRKLNPAKENVDSSRPRATAELIQAQRSKLRKASERSAPKADPKGNGGVFGEMQGSSLLVKAARQGLEARREMIAGDEDNTFTIGNNTGQWQADPTESWQN